MSQPQSLLTFLRDNARFLAAGILLTFMSSFGQTFFIAVFAGEIRIAYGLSHSAWGAIYMIGTMSSAAVMVWAGALSDRLRVKSLGAVVLAGLALTCAAMALSPTVWFLPVIIFALRFFGQGMCTHTSMAAMARWFVASRGKAMSISSLGFFTAEAILPITFVALLSAYDWRVLWGIPAVICLIALPVLRKLLAQERSPQSISESSNATGMLDRHWTRGEAIRTLVFWAMIPAVMGPPAFITSFFFHQLHFAESKGLLHMQLVSFFPIYTLASVAAMMFIGWALDRFGAKRILPFYQIPIGLAFVVFAIADDRMTIGLGILLLAMTSGAGATLANSFWAETFGTRNIGAIKSLSTAFMVLGSAVGPGLTGLLIDQNIALADQGYGIALYFAFTTLGMGVAVTLARRQLPAVAKL